MNWVFFDFSRWDYDVGTPLSRPLGGSQSALSYLATTLARRGDQVTTITGIKQARDVNGVRCLPFSDLPIERFVHPQTIIVLLNGPGEIVPKIRADVPGNPPIILWTQHAYDQPAMAPLRDPALAEQWDRIVCVSQWQRQTFQSELGVGADKMEILRNAVGPAFENMFRDAAHIAEAKSGPPRLAYTSTPYRGLDFLTLCFPPLFRKHPDCRLEVFSSMKLYGYADDKDPFRYIYEKCKDTPGIDYREPLPQPELAKELARLPILTYPNTFAETSCIAVMEALAAGLLVITSDYGALPETCAGWARLVPPISDNWTAEQFAVEFARQVDQALTELQFDRDRWMQRAFEQSQAISSSCNWELRATEWQQAGQRWLNSR